MLPFGAPNTFEKHNNKNYKNHSKQDIIPYPSYEALIFKRTMYNREK